MIELMFSTFQVNGAFIAIQAVLSLYANGRTTGLVVDSGDGVTHTVPVFEGFSIPHAVKKNFIAGRVITGYMAKLLTDDGIAEQGGKGAWFQIVAKVKETLSFVSKDFKADEAKANASSEFQKVFELPDGSTINVNLPRFKAPEGMFKPELIKEGSEEPGLIEIAKDSIQECDLDIRTDLYKNVILSGGSTLYEGMPDRIEDELNAICPQKDIVNIVAPADRYYSVWCGGSTLCTLSTFAAQWITKDEFEENGAEIVHRKCQ
jgi:actin-related protein